MARIVAIMGRSGTGKDTMLQGLLDGLPGLSPLLLYTTRPRRHDLEESYRFVSDAEMDGLIGRHGCVECRSYRTQTGLWRYATIDDGTLAGALAGVLTPAALDSYRKHFGPERVLPILLEVDDKTRLLRAIERESARPDPCYDELCRRHLADSRDFAPEILSALEPLLRVSNQDSELCLRRLRREAETFLGRP